MLDLSYYETLSNNNPIFIKRVLNVFLSNTPEDIDKLKQSIYSKDLNKIKEYSHKLKSIFKSYNLNELTKCIEELEEIGKTGFQDRAFELIHNIIDIFEELKPEIIGVLNRY